MHKTTYSSCCASDFDKMKAFSDFLMHCDFDTYLYRCVQFYKGLNYNIEKT